MVGAFADWVEYSGQRSEVRADSDAPESVATPSPATRPLAEGYYVDNLTFLIRHVERHSSDLLNTAERAFVDDFTALSLDAQRLYVRLISRKGPLFRSDKLSYGEIADLPAAAIELGESGFLDDAPDADIHSLLALLLKPELITLASGSLPATTRRADALDLLATSVTAADVRYHLCQRLGADVLRPLRTDVLDVFRLLFFGNLDQDLTEFVLDELGITPFERYHLHVDARVFESRESVDQACLLYALRAFAAEYLGALSASELLALAIAVPDINEPVTAQRAGRLLVRIGRQLERVGEPDAALDVYRRTGVAPSRERQARLLAQRDEDHDMLRLCNEILHEPAEEGEYEFAIRFAHARARKMNYSLLDWPHHHQPQLQRYRMNLPPADCRVEEVARSWYERGGDSAWYVENRLFPGLFGLAFWDVIFSPVPGAFVHPFQRGPIDLFTPVFGTRRRTAINQRLEELADADCLAERIRSTYADRYPLANQFVHWGGLCPELIDVALERVPPAHLLAVFKRLLRDPRNNRAGFPDLIVFPARGGYRLVEVKGPGDTLQANQKRWLAYFDQYGLPAEVMDIEWQ